MQDFAQGVCHHAKLHIVAIATYLATAQRNGQTRDVYVYVMKMGWVLPRYRPIS
jgi:hypothetical protein